MRNPRIGISVIITNEDKNVLLGKRKNSLGDGTWNFPGGKLKFYESFADCAERETKEETWLDIKLLSDNPVAVTDDFFIEEEEHWATLYMRAVTNQEPRLMEPKKCERWAWFDWNYLPELNLFLPLANLIKQNYFPFRK